MNAAVDFSKCRHEEEKKKSQNLKVKSSRWFGGGGYHQETHRSEHDALDVL